MTGFTWLVETLSPLLAPKKNQNTRYKRFFVNPALPTRHEAFVADARGSELYKYSAFHCNKKLNDSVESSGQMILTDLLFL